MHLLKLPKALAGYQYVGVEGLTAEKALNIDKLLKDLQIASGKWGTPLQVSEALTLCGPTHAIHAAMLALKAHAAKLNRAKKIEIEILLYLSGRRQIGDAITSMGVKNGSKKIAVTALGSSEKAVRGSLTEVKKLSSSKEEDSVLLVDSHKKKVIQKAFGISNDELALVTGKGDWKIGLLKCVMERSAMIDALKR